MSLCKVLGINPFRIADQISEGYDSCFVMSFSARSLRIFTKVNCRFKDYTIQFSGRCALQILWTDLFKIVPNRIGLHQFLNGLDTGID